MISSETNIQHLEDTYAAELHKELRDILSYWMKYAVDEEKNGFYGKISNENIIDKTADKGLVLNARILWAFSASASFTGNKDYLRYAGRAFKYIMDHFTDNVFGGVYWSVTADGRMKDGKKQVYGLAFCIYAMAAYYTATGEKESLAFAKELFHLIERYSYDKQRGGYYEAFTRDWKMTDDQRLSEKDANEKKTMNTHLHVIEAYAALYRVWRDDILKKRILGLLKDFEDHIISKESCHLHLFMDEEWNVKPAAVSFGHDIEAAWLLLESAEITEEKEWISKYKDLSVKITEAASEGLDHDGGLWYEYEPSGNRWIKEKHSWPQAEAMVGYMNAFRLTGDEKYFNRSINSWGFIREHILDKKNGEWFWGVNEDYSVMEGQDKAGFWKCPYHSTRACMEVIKRIKNIQIEI